MEDLYDPEKKIQCPYNSSHHIRRCKMSFHLVKCKKNYGEQKMVHCDFNTTHIIPEPELRYHHQICPDRKKVEAQIIESKNRNEERFPIPVLDVPTEENWDDENVPSYDPKKYTETHDVLRHLDVESGAKRKNFRLNERHRLGGLKTEEAVPQQVEEAVKLPPHRSVMDVSDDKFNADLLQQKLKLNTNKVFLQYKTTPKN